MSHLGNDFFLDNLRDQALEESHEQEMHARMKEKVKDLPDPTKYDWDDLQRALDLDDNKER